MKKLRAAVVGVVTGGVIGVLMFAPSLVKAETDIHEKCGVVAEMAQYAMIHRQSGTAMTDMMKDIDKGVYREKFEPYNPEWVDRAMGGIIKDAYSYPIFGDVRVIEMFTSNWTAICYDRPK